MNTVMCHQIFTSDTITLGTIVGVMRSTIKFYTKFQLWSIEVKTLRTHTKRSPKLHAIHLSGFEQQPH